MMRKRFFLSAVLAAGICALFFAGCDDDPDFGSHETTKFEGSWKGQVPNPQDPKVPFDNSFEITDELTFRAQAGALKAALISAGQTGLSDAQTEIKGSFVPITGDNNYRIEIPAPTDPDSKPGQALASSIPSLNASIYLKTDSELVIDCKDNGDQGFFSTTYTKQTP
jgi:hypothetical protein